MNKERVVLAGSYRYFATRECENARLGLTHVGVNPCTCICRMSFRTYSSWRQHLRSQRYLSIGNPNPLVHILPHRVCLPDIASPSSSDPEVLGAWVSDLFSDSVDGEAFRILCILHLEKCLILSAPSCPVLMLLSSPLQLFRI